MLGRVNARRFGVALMISTILAGTTGCALLDPYPEPVRNRATTTTDNNGVTKTIQPLHRYKTASGETEAEFAAMSDAELLQDSRDLADSMVLSYRRASKTHARTKTGMAATLLGLNTLTLFTAATRNINDGSDLPAANAVGSMGALALGGLLISPTRQAVYQAGEDAMQCAMDRTNAFVVNAEGEVLLTGGPGKPPPATPLAQALTAALTALADARAEKMGIQDAEQAETELTTARADAEKAESDARVQRVAGAAAQADFYAKTQRFNGTTGKAHETARKARDTAWATFEKEDQKLSPLLARITQANKTVTTLDSKLKTLPAATSKGALDAAIGEADKEIAAGRTTLTNARKASYQRRAAALGLRSSVKRIQTAVNRQVLLTEVGVDDIRKALGAMQLPEPPKPAAPGAGAAANSAPMLAASRTKSTDQKIATLNDAVAQLAATRDLTAALVAPMLASEAASECSIAGITGLKVTPPTKTLAPTGQLEFSGDVGDPRNRPTTAIENGEAGLSTEVVLAGSTGFTVRITAKDAKPGAYAVLVRTAFETRRVPFEVAGAATTTTTTTPSPGEPAWLTEFPDAKAVLEYGLKTANNNYDVALATYAQSHTLTQVLDDSHKVLSEGAKDKITAAKVIAGDKATPYELWWADDARIRKLQNKLGVTISAKLDTETRAKFKDKELTPEIAKANGVD